MDKCSAEQDYTKTGAIIAVNEVTPGSLRKPYKCTGNLESERPGPLWRVMSLAKYPWDAKESSIQPTKLEQAAQESVESLCTHVFKKSLDAALRNVV